VVTAKERLKAKKTHVLLSVLVVCVFLSIVVQLLCRGCKEEDSPIEIYADEGLMSVIGTLRQPGLFSDATLGWNNKSFWIRNNGEYPVEIDVYYVLPERWKLCWDFSGRPIEPVEVRKVTISVFAAYPIPAVDKLMFAIDLRYRVIDGE